MDYVMEWSAVATEKAHNMYDVGGVYIFINDGAVSYIGRSRDLRNRIRTHIRQEKLKRPDSIVIGVVLEAQPWAMHILEKQLIRHYQPQQNKLARRHRQSPSPSTRLEAAVIDQLL